MRKNRVIAFDSKVRILKTARHYVESVDIFFDESDRAILLLRNAINVAERDFKRETWIRTAGFRISTRHWTCRDNEIDERCRDPTSSTQNPALQFQRIVHCETAGRLRVNDRHTC